MGFSCLQHLPFAMAMVLMLCFFLLNLVWLCWLSPMKMKRRLEKKGFKGPPPKFPFGNINEMRKRAPLAPNSLINHDIHARAFPYFAQWRKSYGDTFVYWLGTEPFLYVADPEFVKLMNSSMGGKGWGKPSVFKHDRKAMFGKGLLMVEGEEWAHHRQTVAPFFSSGNLKAMIDIMVDSTNKMLDAWSKLVDSGTTEIDVESEITRSAAEIIARASFGVSYENGKDIFKMLRAIQQILFKSQRPVGVPYNGILHLRNLRKAVQLFLLSKQVDSSFLKLVNDRRSNTDIQRTDLLGLLLRDGTSEKERRFTSQELVDECKTFFFAGHETTSLALSWTLMLLASHVEWQKELREEVMEATKGETLDSNMLPKLKKMGWVMKEVMRLYPSGPNVQRQAREDIQIGDKMVPKGTNIWVDIVALHHDPRLWGEDVNEFKPQRFREGVQEACKHRTGVL
ncbi:hypothetical protein AMTR_s00009p00250080 [Amborella trichopoda]|uniref:Cytochrome P450 n=1 Tax=Amborella trichopoda TaxID=13333 RepID=W1NHW1_AMBTC|nr:hypothetical protein AMTR_s00009p00250080 [Amborella trichopoda]